MKRRPNLSITISLIEQDDVGDYLNSMNQSSIQQSEIKSHNHSKDLKRKYVTINDDSYSFQPDLNSRYNNSYTTQPERNPQNSEIFNCSKTVVEKDLSIVKGLVASKTRSDIPSRIQHKLDTNQLSTWKRALDDRIWRRKIDTHTYTTSQLLKEKKVAYTKSQIVLEKRLEANKNERDTIRYQKGSMDERVDRVRRMCEVVKKREKRDLDVDKKENAQNIIFNDYFKKQRVDIIEKRREAKEVEKDVRGKMKDEQDANEMYKNDRLSMRKEKFENAKRVFNQEAKEYEWVSFFFN